MSLRPNGLPQIPAETSRVARAAFPNRCLAMRARDALGPLFTDEQFAELFAGHCCIESEGVDEVQRSGGSPHGEAAKNDLKHAIVTAICRVERPSGGSRKG